MFRSFRRLTTLLQRQRLLHSGDEYHHLLRAFYPLYAIRTFRHEVSRLPAVSCTLLSAASSVSGRSIH